MTRGCQKRIIHIKETESALFEEAYFILRSGVGDKRAPESQMLKEANRIIDEGARFTYPSRPSKKSSFFKPFAIGAAVSALVCLALVGISALL